MRKTILGRTGLTVGVGGLGCGGKSRIGRAKGEPLEESIRLVHEALDLGMNYLDSSETYGTEDVLGLALRGRHDDAVIATKVLPRTKEGGYIDAPSLRTHVEESLRRLQTDSIEVLQLHGVYDLKEYQHCVDELVPEMQALRDKGMIRFLGLSEHFTDDFGHVVLQKALLDDYWDVMLVGFNLLNASARESVFKKAIENNIGIVAMFVVRHIFSHPEALKNVIAETVKSGLLDSGRIDMDDPLGFLVHDGAAISVVDAAYRFAVHEPGIDVALTGTGNIDHLRSNARSLSSAPLPFGDLKELYDLFGHLSHFAGD